MTGMSNEHLSAEILQAFLEGDLKIGRHSLHPASAQRLDADLLDLKRIGEAAIISPRVFYDRLK